MALFRSTVALVLALGTAFATPALAQKKYDTGASDTEIKVGQTIPLSGPASAYGGIDGARWVLFGPILTDEYKTN